MHYIGLFVLKAFGKFGGEGGGVRDLKRFGRKERSRGTRGIDDLEKF